MSDRIRTRWGRRKPFILIGMPIFMLGVWLLWIPPIEFREVTWLGMTFNTGYPYLLAVLVIMYVGATIKDVPYSAWGAELAQGYNERTLVMSWKEAFTVSGSLIGAMTPAVIVFWGYTKPTDNVYFLTIALLFVMPLLIFNLLYAVPEHRVKEYNTQRLSLQSFRYVWANEPYRVLVIIFLFSTIGSAMTNSLSFSSSNTCCWRVTCTGFILPLISFRKLWQFRYGSNCPRALENTELPWSRFSGTRYGLALYR